ncbi:GAF domain-containing protein [Methylobacterium sp. E-045]|uniref:GAF domain-containing protein n=1 Tax=Methylobacterium sp. E-045 TaxID=2836575 RepID=UPI001FBB6ED1|nr:GAF domain-containing protein [Methylobacterium sp. E-045]MCJ2131699.1 GAF domain-containing protein [Methylobacterium sp. E-045]
MQRPPPSAETGERERLAVLDDYAVLDTPPEPSFDGIVLLARAVCAAPVALLSLVAEGRQWFKARSGFVDCGTELDASVCRHVLGRSDMLVIPDLTCDGRTRTNPLVTGAPHIRFYAGAPLVTPDGHGLGTLCVIDTEPRPEGLTEEQRECLQVLAGLVMAHLDMRRALVAKGSP